MSDEVQHPGHQLGAWERAHEANKQRRTAEAQRDIAEARAMPTEVEVQAQAEEPQLADRRGCTCSAHWKSLTWTQNGPTPHMKGCPDANGGGYSSEDEANAATRRFAAGMWHSPSGLAMDEAGGVPRTRAGQLEAVIEACRPPETDALTLSGAKLEAYRKLEAAAGAAQAAQSAMATTGAALREAIQGLCALLAPGDGK